MTDLAACPFCGGAPMPEDWGDDEHAVGCPSCGAHGPVRPTLDAAAAAWRVVTVPVSPFVRPQRIDTAYQMGLPAYAV